MDVTHNAFPKGETVHLILKGHWFDEIVSGRKRVEYRDNTRYWQRRIIKKNPSVAVFHRGYTNRTAAFKVTQIILLARRIEMYLGDLQAISEGEK